MKRILFTNAITSDNFYDQLSTTEDTIILAEKKWWKVLSDWNKDGKIHLGIRSAGWKYVKYLPFLCIKYNNHITRIIINDDVLESNNIARNIELGKYDIKLNPPSTRIVSPEELSIELFDSLGTGNIGFDFETNAMSPMTPDFLPMGLSLCNEFGQGFYIEMRWNRDYMGDSYKLLREFIINNQFRLITYNCKFEMSCVATIFHTIIYPKDAMALCVADDMYTNLKLNSQYYLYTPSWDDEMDEESTLWEEYNTNHDQSVLNKIINQRSIKENIDKQQITNVYNKILADPLLNCNPWSECYPETVGRYCIIDAYYTVLIYNMLLPKYPNASEIYLQNFYMGSLFNLFPFHISTKRLEIIHDESNRILRSIGLYKMRYYYELLNERLANYDFSKISQYAINIINYDPSLISLGSNIAILKTIVKSVNTTNPNNLQSILVSIYGEYGNTIYSIIINSNKPIDKLLRARNIWIDMAKNITEDLSTIIFNHNRDQLVKYKDKILSFNDEIDKLRKQYNIIYCNDGLLSEVLPKIHTGKTKSIKDKIYYKYIYDFNTVRKCKNEIKSLMNKWSENIAIDKQGMDTRNNIDTRNFDIIKLCSRHIDVNLLKDHMYDYNILKWLPTAFYAENNDIIPFESIVDYIKLSQYKNEFNKLDNKTIYDDTNDINISIKGYELNTADRGFQFIDEFVHKYHTTIKLLSQMFVLDVCMHSDENILKNYAKGILDNFNTKSDLLVDVLLRSGYDLFGADDTDSILTIISMYENIRIRDKEITSKFEDIDLYPHSNDKLTININDFVCFARFVNYIMIQAFANKQLTTYIPHYYNDCFEQISDNFYGKILKNKDWVYISNGEIDSDEDEDRDIYVTIGED
jgi:hypothetical protein